MSNFDNTVLYIGITNSIYRRVIEHKEGILKGFTSKYKLIKLVYYEQYKYVYDAINREKQSKAGSRRKKEELIKSINPDWLDLSQELLR